MTAEVEITRPDKMLWPALAITKVDYAEYLDAVVITCCHGFEAGRSP